MADLGDAPTFTDNSGRKREAMGVFGAGSDDANPLFVTASGRTPRVTASISVPADATTFAIGDHIANSMTGALVTPMLFSVGRASGRISGARATVRAASGTIVLPAFDLLLFRPATNIPFAAGSFPANNAALNISGDAMDELVAVIPFSASLWRNQAGGATAAGSAVYQPGVPVLRPFAPFNFDGLATQNLVGIVQAQSAWAPGNVAQTLRFALDTDAD